jgi:hypothetical protein
MPASRPTVIPAFLLLQFQHAERRARREEEGEVSQNPVELPPQRITGGDPVSFHVGPGGVVVLQELREDGTVGIAIQVPPDEWNESYVEWFRRIVSRKQGRRRLRLME